MPAHQSGVLADWSGSFAMDQGLVHQTEMLELAHEAVIVRDLQDRILYWNRAAERLYGWPLRDVIGREAASLLNTRFPLPFDEVTRLLSQEGRWEGELTHVRRDGAPLIVFSRWALQRDLAGRHDLILELSIDITRHKRSEEMLRRLEHEFGVLAGNVPELFSYIDAELRYRFVNQRYQELFGIPTAQILGRSVRDLVGPTTYAVMESRLKDALAGRPVFYEYPIEVPDEGLHWLLARYLPDRDDKGRVRGLFALVSDITSQKHAEEALHRNQEQMQALASRLITVQEEERRRIARDLHDDIGQRLAAILLDLAALERRPPESPVTLSTRLAPLRVELGRLSDDLHRLAYGLHPSLLEHAGLAPAVRDHAQDFAKRTGLTVRVTEQHLPGTLPLAVATCLFRVVQESLQNVAKHARATEAAIRLRGSEKGIGLSVTDNGTGFSAEPGAPPRQGLGLVSMEERLRHQRGVLRIRSLPGRGTKVCAWIPRPFQESP